MIQTAIGGAFTVVSVVLTFVLTNRQAERRVRDQQIADLVRVTRDVVESQRQIVEALQPLGIYAKAPTLPRGWQ